MLAVHKPAEIPFQTKRWIRCCVVLGHASRQLSHAPSNPRRTVSGKSAWSLATKGPMKRVQKKAVEEVIRLFARSGRHDTRDTLWKATRELRLWRNYFKLVTKFQNMEQSCRYHAQRMPGRLTEADFASEFRMQHAIAFFSFWWQQATRTFALF